MRRAVRSEIFQVTPTPENRCTGRSWFVRVIFGNEPIEYAESFGCRCQALAIQDKTDIELMARTRRKLAVWGFLCRWAIVPQWERPTCRCEAEVW